MITRLGLRKRSAFTSILTIKWYHKMICVLNGNKLKVPLNSYNNLKREKLKKN